MQSQFHFDRSVLVKLMALLVSLVVLSGCAKPLTFLRADADYAQKSSDIRSCLNSFIYTGSNAANFISGYKRGRAERIYLQENCMPAKGWVPYEMESDEFSHISNLNTDDEKGAYLRELYQKRIANNPTKK